MNISGSMWTGRARFTPLFDLAVFINMPAEIRVDRLRSRQLSLHKERVLKGGRYVSRKQLMEQDVFLILWNGLQNSA